MMQKIINHLRNVRDDESGAAYIMEFVILFPLIFLIFLSSFEIGFRSYRHMFLDRAVDLAVRDVRLNTGANFTHSTLKIAICNYAGFLPDCDNDLKLEMTPVNVRGWSGSMGQADCIDQSQAVNPVRQFQNGVQHELMILRACYLYDPVFPLFGLGKSYYDHGQFFGRIPLITADAFVQEP